MNKIILATALSALSLAAAPAFAQDAAAAPAASGYLNLGYTHLDPAGTQLNTLGGRVGARFWNYFGLEGEAQFGVGHDTTSLSGYPATTSMAHSVAGYAVGFLPVMPNLDLLARVGYGNTHLNTTVAGYQLSNSVDSVNYGVGAQYFFTGHDGLRVDYTRDSYRDNFGHANVWGVSYVRKF